VAGLFAGGVTTPLTAFRFRLVGNQLTALIGTTTYLTVSDATFASGSVGIRTSQFAGVDDFAAAGP